jgi:hypothetical protein
MPFKSVAQKNYLFVHNPKLAEEFAKKTKNMNHLPMYVKRKK